MNKILNEEDQLIKFGTKLSALYIILGVIGFVILILPMIYYSNDKIDNIGVIGDTVGGILNPILAVPAITLTFLAFWVQYQANQEIQKQFKIQQFESQFYEMLRLHKENINEMKIAGYDYKMSISYNSADSSTTTTRTQVERFVEGRKVFVSMANELIACYRICKACDKENKYKSKELLELSYRIFFFGSQSTLIKSKTIDSTFITIVKDELKEIRKKHRETVGGVKEYQVGDKKIKFFIKYSPFTGHENKLGHYYRHLYGIVKYVVDRENEGLFTYSKSREYLKILRSQMSNNEQLMLYYNYIIGFGRDWESKKSGNEYFTKYRMLHNLPIDKVKYATKPRVHFKSFIDSIDREKEGSLFEWGDFDDAKK